MTRRAVVEQVMGLPVSLHLDGPEAESPATQRAVADAFAVLHEADGRFTTYRDDSEVMRLRDGRLDLADASPDVHEVLRLCDLARERTGGLFDAYLPDAEGRRVLDPSGLVKGWAAARAARVLDAVPGLAYSLNAGGDVVVGGQAPRGWRIGIEDPRDRSRILFVVERSVGAVATSGTAARGAHLVDPRDGGRPASLLAVTVVGESLMWADVLATAAFVRGPDAVEWVSRQVGYAALAVHADGVVEADPTLL
ncbi:MAG: FAD:protein FMN transferase [Angustibacter sp.]